MDSPRSPAGSTRRHNRNISHPLPRRSTRGPLDAADDPLSPSSQQSSDSPSVEQDISLPPPQITEKPPLNVDLHFLKDPSHYHQLGTEDIPQVFLDSQNQPPSDTPLQDLLQHGHFRRAAGTALIDLHRCAADDAVRIFQLLYIRLACLVLISRADLAAVEAASLTDFLARDAPGAAAVTPIIPWELRILLVRLQSIAAADGGRRGIMALYAISAEVRMHVKESKATHDDSAITLWSGRLRDLGLRVADTLVEMGELETATRHLDTLVDVSPDELAHRKALLRLRIGDVAGAQRSIDRITSPATKATLTAVVAVANGDIDSAREQWRTLSASGVQSDALAASNLAVAQLYSGDLAASRQLFEELSKQHLPFPGLLFNLGTAYELSTDRAAILKSELATQMAGKTPGTWSGGWERAIYEFKL